MREEALRVIYHKDVLKHVPFNRRLVDIVQVK